MSDTIKLKEHYLSRFRFNAREYLPEHARKKNADIRKIVMTDGPDDKREAINAAWAEFYGYFKKAA